MKNALPVQMIIVMLLLWGLVSAAWGKTVNLAWDPSPSAVSGYKVYYKVGSDDFSAQGGVGTVSIDVGPVLSYVLTDLDSSVDHFFAVTAYDASGQESGFSNSVQSPAEVLVNSPPILAPIGNRTVLEGAELSFVVSATDPDGDSLSYTTSTLPSGAGFNSSTRTFSWVPGMNQAGVYSVNFRVSDGAASVNETISITVVNVNRAPVLQSIGTKSVNEGELLAFTILATDADNDPLTYSASGLPSGAVFNPVTRQFRWTPDYSGSSNIRVFSVTFSVSDGFAEAAELVTININPVNRPPVLEPIGPQALVAGDNYNLIINASDPDGNQVTYSVSGLPAGAVFAPSTRSFSWIPGNEQAGTHAVTFTASDGSLQDSEVVLFTVTRANEPPVLSPIGPRSVNENALLSFTISATSSSENYVFSATGLPSGATFDPGSRVFNWTPGFEQAGSFIVTFRVTDGTDSDSESVTITVHNTNRSPVISGQPTSYAPAGQNYFFAPTASDPDGDALSFTISSLPFWANFNQHTGVLSGAPVAQDVGVSANILITVTDGTLSASLPPFSIEVVPTGDDPEPDYVDGELDSDGDGIPDIRDGFPYDPTRSDWVILASAGTGGYIDPVGENSVLFGGSQSFSMTPKAGYYINDLLVNGVSVGLLDSYEFTNVNSHHTIEAVFSAIPKGLSQNPLEPGLSGIERPDGGDDANNLVGGKPKLDLDYRFSVVLRETGTLDQYRVFAVINGYRYPLERDQGVLASGARFSMTTKLGPAYQHKFYFIAENAGGAQLWRYPATGELPGPVVELLSGRNLIGIVANINPYGLNSTEVVGVKQLYRWDPSAKGKGSYIMVDNGGPVASGEGYLLKRSTGSTLLRLDSYGEIAGADYEFVVSPGWNLIANPYGGNVPLEQVKVRVGDAAPVDWLTAAAQLLVVDGLYSYQGDDWGGGNEFFSAAGTNRAVLVPWIGYWVYINPASQPISLLISRPLK